LPFPSRFALILLFTSSLFSLELQKITLQLNWLNQFQFAGYYMAKEKGFYKDAGLDVDIKEYNNNINVTEEVATKKATYGIGRSNLIAEKANGVNIKLLFASFQSSPSILIATKKSGIKNIKDFIGKKIMMTDSVLNSVSLYAMMNQQYVHINDIQHIKPSFDVQDLVNGKTDLMASYISNEPFVLDKQKISYTIFDPKNYGFDFYSDILFTSDDEVTNNRQRVINFKNASLKGWEYAFAHIEETVEVILNKYNTQHKSKEALLYEAKELKKLAYYKTDTLGNINKKKIEKIYDIYHILGMITKKINLDTLIFKDTTDKGLLTYEEKKWIKENPTLTFSQINWEPLSIIANKKTRGIVKDYLDLISKRSGLHFRYIPLNSWQEVLNKFKNKELDILPASKHSFVDKSTTLVSNIYKTYPMVIVTKNKYKYVESLNILNGKMLALPKNYTSYNYVKKNFPDIKIIETTNIEEALILVETGKAEAFIGHIATSLSHLNKLHLQNLKVSGITNFDFEHVLFVHKKDKVLLSILNKAIDTITFEEKNKIDAKWINIKIVPTRDYSLLWQIAGILIIIISLLIYRNRKLKEYNSNLEEAHKIILDKDISLKNLNKELENRANDAIKDLKKVYKLVKIGTWKLDIKKDYLIWNDITYSIFQRDEKANPIKSIENFRKLIHKDDLKKVEDAYYGHLETGKPYFVMHRIVLDDGTIKYVEERGKTIYDENKNPINSWGTVQDVTQQQLGVIELRKKDEQLLQQSRLAQMGEMLSMIAHQWRQPLSAISATTSNLRLKIMLGEIDEEILEEEMSLIDSYTQHLSKTIDDFRGFLHEDTIKKETTLEEIILSTILIIEKSFENKKITLYTNFTCNKKLNTYANEIKQVLLNLLKNAEDALLDNKTKNPQITIKTFVKNKNKIITVQDNAGGISSNIKNKIFEPYFSTKKKKNGTGLGLYMSKMIIEEHCNGKLYFQSDENGTTFFIEFNEGG
jgi:C4-dicarboxylate-specific signal transduction histidine kinase/ABC-type nitrate/sulfonate/bicarbonate transport system substrate-binding protein